MAVLFVYKKRRVSHLFVGSINVHLRSLLAEITREWDCEEIYIGCSGNFTIESILKDRGFKLHGNDVSLYTCNIGNYLAGNKMDIRIKDESMKWLEPYMTEGIPRIATLLLCTTMLEGYHRTETFFERKRRAYHSQWEQLHKETCERVELALEGINLESFNAGDVVEHALSSPEDQGFISFPPTYAGGYERLYQAFEMVFDWDEPEYEIFDDERLEVMLEAVQKKKHWMMARDEPIETLEDYMISKIQTSLRSKTVYVYASHAKKRITTPRVKTELLKLPRATDKTVFTEDSKVSLVRISKGELNTLRSLYLNPGIAPAVASLNIAVMVDKQLIGAIALSKSQYSMGEAYMIADFAIRPTQYKRLSKLVLAISLTHEVRRWLEHILNTGIKSITTTAFTAKPQSMKYRGLYKIHSKKDENRINYFASAGKWDMKEAYDWWFKTQSKYRV
jgi:hypothetical protein